MKLDVLGESGSLDSVIEVCDLHMKASNGHSFQTILTSVSFAIQRGETLALVGESGSGKSMTANAVLGLLPRSIHVSKGRIIFEGHDILSVPDKKRRALLGKEIGFVFQDYQSSFTPFLKIGDQLIETLRTHQTVSKNESKKSAMEWLTQVGLPAERVYDSYPFQLSGGQMQRTALAAAMMLQPKLLIADEVTTALDVWSGEVVLDLLVKLQRQTGCAVLMISHDLRQVLKRADRVAVMKDGKILEQQTAQMIQKHPEHPYTQMLLDAKPPLPEVHFASNQRIESGYSPCESFDRRRRKGGKAGIC
ncbi:ATP-binding cassette domain-containing protein [Brevibacillus choshinensis]|uniref:ABC transporter ATP-binding protein n=1 Tax=Brevibacillus choshinensis TaxID=54911 RepID=A0ABX7FTG8_BRECH|nr:ABC transporter ATP-binding protein [Brevibacillus choshinensis]QRG69467.1 ABC transporter ATP-binding protein [Brevibacillus choshinensis]